MALTNRNRIVIPYILCVILVFFVPTRAHPGLLESGSRKWFHGLEDSTQPYMAAKELNLTAILGNTASMPCRVFSLRDKTVSWIRSRDLTVLAVDQFVVSTDSRFSVSHIEDSDDWILEIRGVDKTDEGTYECQVNTHPKVSTKIHLRVLPKRDRASILDMPISDTGVITDNGGAIGENDQIRGRVIGPRRLQIPSGNSLQLVCEVTGRDLALRIPDEPLVQWTVDGFPVTSLWPPDKVLVRESWVGSSLESELLVSVLTTSDGGSYTCNIPGAPSDRVAVTIVPVREVATPSRLSDSGFIEESSSHEETEGISASASRAAVLSGAIILVLLLIQAALCVFYIKKV